MARFKPNFIPTTKINLQWLYEDLMARFEPNFNSTIKINLQWLFDHPTTSLTKKKIYKYCGSIPSHT